MLYTILAIIVALFHGLIVVILFSGVLFALFNKLRKWPVVERIYLTAAILMIASFILTGGCFLTSWEQWLWREANSLYYYRGGFISHYLAFTGIRVADDVVYWILVLSLVLGLGSYVVRYSLTGLSEVFGRNGSARQ